MNHTEQEALEEPKEVNGFFCIFSPFWRFHFYLGRKWNFPWKIRNGKNPSPVQIHIYQIRYENSQSLSPSYCLSLSVAPSITWRMSSEHQFFSHLRVFITSTTAGIFEGRHDISLAQLMDFIDFITSSLLLLITLQRKTQSITLLMDACLLAQHKMGKCWWSHHRIRHGHGAREGGLNVFHIWFPK